MLLSRLIVITGLGMGLWAALTLVAHWHIAEALALLVLTTISVWSAWVGSQHAPQHRLLFGSVCTAATVTVSGHLAGGLPPGHMWAWLGFAGMLLIGPMFLHLAVTFPVRRPGLFWPVFLSYPAAGAVGILGALGRLGSDWNPIDPSVDAARTAHLVGQTHSGTGVPGLVALLIMLSAGALILLDTSRRARAAGNQVVQRQALILVLAVIVAWAPALAFVPGMLPPNAGLIMHVMTASYAVLPLAGAIALTRPNLYDSGAIVRRAMNYTSLVTAAIVIYLVLVRVLSALVTRLPSGGDHDSPVFFSALLVALLVRPLQVWMEDQLDRLFFPDRLGFRELLAETSHALSTTIVLEDLEHLAINELPARLGASGAALLVLDGANRNLVSISDHRLLLPAGHPLRARNEGTAHYRVLESHLEAGALALSAPALLLPLHAGGRLVGLYGLGARVYGLPYTRDELSQLTVLGHHLAVAVENGRAYRKIDELRRRTISEVEERNGLAREIHDTLAQGLTGIGLQLEVVQATMRTDPARAERSVARALDVVRSNLSEARRSVLELRAPLLGGDSLPDGLLSLVEQAAGDLEAAGDFQLEGAYASLPARLETALYRIAQEALHNAVKHSRATRLRVVLALSSTAVRVSVEDNGVGFDPSGLHASSGRGFGLLGMGERAHLLDGQLEVESLPSVGTRVTVTVPLCSNGEEEAQ